MRENVGKVEISSQPIDGKSTDAVGADTSRDDVGQFTAIGFDAVNAIDFVLVELDPVDPTAIDMNVNMKNIVTRSGDWDHGLTGAVTGGISHVETGSGKASSERQLRDDGKRFVRNATRLSFFA